MMQNVWQSWVKLMTRVLITGITGMAGSHLADFLLEEQKDCEIFGVKRSRSPMENIEAIKDQINLIDAELTDSSAVLNVISKAKPDYIFHLAAHSFVPDSWQNPFTTFRDNVGMQLTIFEAVRQAKLDPVIQIACSSEEYGKVLPGEVPINEKNPLRPLSPYGVSKVTQDMLGYQYFQSYGLKVIRTRAFNHEGPRRGEVFVSSNFAKQVAEIEAGLKPPVVYVGNLDAQRDWSDVRDVVRAYWLAVKHGAPGEDYVIASGVSRSIKEMLDLLLSFSDSKIEVKTDPARLRPSDVQILQGDASKFKKVSGWTARYSFQDTMLDLLNYWRERLGVPCKAALPHR
jgi:GDP-4-dehydro-6-deoxy-D-mannose reductase